MTSQKSGFNNDGRPVEQLPWARNGFVQPTTWTSRSGRKKKQIQIQIQIQRDRVSWKRTEFSVPRHCSSKACHKEGEKRRIQKPTAPEGEKWVQCTTGHHWSSRLWKRRKTGKQKQKHCIFLTSFFDKTYYYKSLIIYVWWWLCLIILKKVQNWCWALTQS